MSYDIEVTVNNIKEDSHADDLTLNFEGEDISNFSTSLSSDDVSDGSLTHTEEDLEGTVDVIIDYPSESPWYETQSETTDGSDITFDLQLVEYDSTYTLQGIEEEEYAEGLEIQYTGEYIDDFTHSVSAEDYNDAENKVVVTQENLKGEVCMVVDSDPPDDWTGNSYLFAALGAMLMIFAIVDMISGSGSGTSTGTVEGEETCVTPDEEDAEDVYEIPDDVSHFDGHVYLSGIQEADHLDHFNLNVSGDYFEDFDVDIEQDDFDDGEIYEELEDVLGEITVDLEIDNEAIWDQSDPISDGELDYKERSWVLDEDNNSIDYNVKYMHQVDEDVTSDNTLRNSVDEGEILTAETPDKHYISFSGTGEGIGSISVVLGDKGKKKSISTLGVETDEGEILTASTSETPDDEDHISLSGTGEGIGSISVEEVEHYHSIPSIGIGEGIGKMSVEELILVHRIMLDGIGEGKGSISVDSTDDLYLMAEGLGTGKGSFDVEQEEPPDDFFFAVFKGIGAGKGYMQITRETETDWDPIESLAKKKLSFGGD